MEVVARDRPGLLREFSEVLSRDKVNVTAVHTLSRDAHARMRLTVEVRTVADIQRVLFHLMEAGGRAGSTTA